MNAPKFSNSSMTDISNGWSTNVVENSVAFRELAYFTLTFSHGLDVPLVLDGLVVVIFFYHKYNIAIPWLIYFHHQYGVKYYCIISVRNNFVWYEK